MIFLKKFKPIKISKPAEIDIKDISLYTLKQWGKAHKTAYLGLFKNLFLDLSYHAESIQPLIKDRTEIYAGLLSYRINQHVVFFRNTKHEILIVRILHTRMDPEKHLNE